MSKTISLAIAKAHLSECVRDVELGDAILITRHGKPVAALVHADELEQLERLRKSGPQTGLVSIAGGWDNSEELIDIIDRTPRRGSRSLPEMK